MIYGRAAFSRLLSNPARLKTPEKSGDFSIISVSIILSDLNNFQPFDFPEEPLKNAMTLA
jgi:hypothetical protein|tara:strand:- start:12 stop:191 length:180 start_codon:yes stop_codon:yes gene_type:complete